MNRGIKLFSLPLVLMRRCLLIFICCRLSIAQRKGQRKATLQKGEIRILDRRGSPGNEIKGFEGLKLWVAPINGGKLGDVFFKEGEKIPSCMLRYVGDRYNKRTDPEGYAAMKAAPGDCTLELGKNLFHFSLRYRDELAKGVRPASDGGGLVDHLSEEEGANITFELLKGEDYPTPRAIKNICIGDMLYMDYEGKGSGYWLHHPTGKVPDSQPLRVNSVMSCTHAYFLQAEHAFCFVLGRQDSLVPATQAQADKEA